MAENIAVEPLRAGGGVQSNVEQACPGHIAPGLRFRFPSRDRAVEKCLWHALLHPPLVRTAVVTSLVVGTILTGINQGNSMVAGTLPGDLIWKIPLTYAVPYSVATFSALRITRLK